MKAFMTRRKSFFVAATAALALSLSACGGGGTDAGGDPSVAAEPTFAAGTTMEKLASAGTIKIGTKFDQPLFGQVDAEGNPQGFDFLARDATTMATWFARRGLDVDAGQFVGDLVAEATTRF